MPFREEKRHIKLWHIKLFPVTPVTGPGRVPGHKNVWSLGFEDSTEIFDPWTCDQETPPSTGWSPAKEIYVYCPGRNYYWIESGKSTSGNFWDFFSGIFSCQTDSSNLSCKKNEAWKLPVTRINSGQGLSRYKISNLSEINSWKHFSLQICHDSQGACGTLVSYTCICPYPMVPHSHSPQEIPIFVPLRQRAFPF